MGIDTSVLKQIKKNKFLLKTLMFIFVSRNILEPRTVTLKEGKGKERQLNDRQCADDTKT